MPMQGVTTGKLERANLRKNYFFQVTFSDNKVIALPYLASFCNKYIKTPRTI